MPAELAFYLRGVQISLRDPFEPCKHPDEAMDAEHTIDQVYPIFLNLARTMGRLYGVELGVAPFEANLMFVDDLGEMIVDGESAVLCATQAEIENGAALQLFSGRALYAAVVRKFKLLGA